jgi:colanic acid/amylovoran biosynthesis glycosyltransferase
MSVDDRMLAPVRAVIWKNTWLPRSETFIRDQIAEYTRTEAITFGLTREQPPLTEPDLILLRRPRLRTAADRFITRSPRLDRLVGRAAGARLRDVQPDFIHAHFGIDGMTALGASDILRRPLIVTFHGYDASATGRPGLERYFDALPTLFARSAGLIAVSSFVADRLKQLGAPTDRVHVHHIGVRLPERRALAEGDAGYVLFVGRLVPKKGVDVLLRAFAALPAELRDTPLILVGDGHLRTELEKLARELHLNARFTGPLPSDQVATHIRNAALLCAPSKRAPDGDSEGLPMVILEAGAWGVPVVAADHAGIRDAVTHGHNGLLFPEGDEAALAAALSSLLADAAARRSLGATAREVVQQRFDIVTQTALLEDLYGSLVS